MLRHLVLAASIAVAPTIASATTVTDTLPEFNFFGSPPLPTPPQTVGQFTFGVPLTGILVDATLSGTFGNSRATNSSAVQLFADGIFVGECASGAACTVNSLTTPFSFALPDLSILSDGMVDLTAVQTASGAIRLGETTLTVRTTPIPLPFTGWLLASGLAALGLVRVRRGA